MRLKKDYIMLVKLGVEYLIRSKLHPDVAIYNYFKFIGYPVTILLTAGTIHPAKNACCKSLEHEL